MADFTNTATPGTIESGTKEEPTVSTFAMTSADGTESSPYINAIKPVFIMGEKETTYTPLIADSPTGSLVVTEGDPVTGSTYSIVEETQTGTKYQHPTERLLLASQPDGQLKSVVYNAVSTQGLDYVPVIQDEEDKAIRRWPRDWHGDNMKN